MVEVKADCFLSEEFKHGSVNLSRFRYEDGLDSVRSKTLNVLIEDHDFKLVFVIERWYKYDGDDLSKDPSFEWRSLKPSSSDRNIYGFFEVGIPGEETTKHFFSGGKGQPVLLFDLSDVRCSGSSKIRLDVTVYHEDRRISSLSDDYEKLFESTTRSDSSTDLVFEVDHVEVPAHKAIVEARSPELTKKFLTSEGSWRVKKIRVTDIEPQVFKQVIRFVYCGKVDAYDVDALLKLLRTAHEYSIKDLKSACEFRLSCCLELSRVTDVLLAADKVAAEYLKRTCISTMLFWKHKPVVAEAYKKLRKSRPDLIAQICDAIMLDGSRRIERREFGRSW